jgi:23S rRNA pseudouridine2605 synthase
MKERIQKVLANAGLGSRREVEAWIKDGRINVNGKPASLGDKISEEDRITLDGKPIRRHQKQIIPRTIVYHKPVGEVCTRHDPEGRATIFRKLPKPDNGRWVAVGRLDINTSGLMLLTTDGELANRLMHPSSMIPREYSVRVLGNVSEEQLEQLVQGVQLEDGPARFEEIVDAGGEGANHWYYVLLAEGRKREVRRLWEAVGVTVSRLIRVRFGPIFLEPRIKTGRWEELNPEQTRELYESVRLPVPDIPGMPVKKKRGRPAGKRTRKPPGK